MAKRKAENDENRLVYDPVRNPTSIDLTEHTTRRVVKGGRHARSRNPAIRRVHEMDVQWLDKRAASYGPPGSAKRLRMAREQDDAKAERDRQIAERRRKEAAKKPAGITGPEAMIAAIEVMRARGYIGSKLSYLRDKGYSRDIIDNAQRWAEAHERGDTEYADSIAALYNLVPTGTSKAAPRKKRRPTPAVPEAAPEHPRRRSPSKPRPVPPTRASKPSKRHVTHDDIIRGALSLGVESDVEAAVRRAMKS